MMTEQDWIDIDRSSRTIVSCLLSAIGCEEIGEMVGNCCVDLSCVAKGKTIAVEIKDRTFSSTKFGDILVEDIKQSCTTRRIGKGQFQTALAVNLYTDNVIAIANMFDKDAKHFQKYAPCTTLVKGADHSYVKKDFCSLPQRKKYKYEEKDGKLKFTKLK